MTIELTNDEVDLIDKALTTWARDPHSSGLAGMMLSAFLSKDTPPHELERKQQEQQRKIEADVTQRERRTLILRAKLQAALDGRSLSVT